MDQDIEALVQACQPYQLVKNIPFVSLLHPWLWASKPWVCVHIDLAGPFQKKIFILVLDVHSKWPEIIEMPSITTSKTIIEELKETFFSISLTRISHYQQWTTVHCRRVHDVLKTEWYKTFEVFTVPSLIKWCHKEILKSK